MAIAREGSSGGAGIGGARAALGEVEGATRLSEMGAPPWVLQREERWASQAFIVEYIGVRMRGMQCLQVGFRLVPNVMDDVSVATHTPQTPVYEHKCDDTAAVVCLYGHRAYTLLSTTLSSSTTANCVYVRKPDVHVTFFRV